jgi:hypothetical protein
MKKTSHSKQSDQRPDIIPKIKKLGRATYRTYLNAIYEARKKDDKEYTHENAAYEFIRMLDAGKIRRDWNHVGLGEDAPATYFVP